MKKFEVCEWTILHVPSMRWYKGMSKSGNQKWTPDACRAALLKKSDPIVKLAKHNSNCRVVKGW